MCDMTHSCMWHDSFKCLCFQGRVARCCSAVQCVAVCCSAVQCVAVWCFAVCYSALKCVAMWHFAVCCGAVQCVAVWRFAVFCSALQCVAVWHFVAVRYSVLQCVTVCCSVAFGSVLQCVTVYAWHDVITSTYESRTGNRACLQINGVHVWCMYLWRSHTICINGSRRQSLAVCGCVAVSWVGMLQNGACTYEWVTPYV